MYSALYTEFILYVCLFVFSCISEIVRNPRIKYIRSHGHLVPMFLCFQVFKFNFNPLLFLPWESQNLIWSRLSFQTFSKMQGTIPKRKKKMQAGFYFVFSVLGCLYYHSSWIAKNLMCCISRHLAKGRNSFCGGISMLELTLTNGTWQWEYNLILKNKLQSCSGCFVLP